MEKKPEGPKNAKEVVQKFIKENLKDGIENERDVEDIRKQLFKNGLDALYVKKDPLEAIEWGNTLNRYLEENYKEPNDDEKQFLDIIDGFLSF